MTAASIAWTDEKVDELKRRWEAGETCSQIAGEMAGFTRNAIIGKVCRLGLTKRRPSISAEEALERLHARRRLRQGIQERRAQEPKPPRHRERKVQEPSVPVVRTPFVGALNIPFGDLRPWLSNGTNECRFIAAEIAGPDYLACGNETLAGESWCGHCREIVYQRAPVATLVPEKVAA
jgi:GcrA cell cycle regulator